MSDEEIIKTRAVKCVVCNGHGTVGYQMKTCPGCSGKCFLVIPNEILNEKGKTKNENFNKTNPKF
jgi:hypothetical protein